MTDGAKAVVWQATWTPWGAPHAITGSTTLNARFPGQWYQLEAGLHYNWHRHYDPSLGRYTQPDPLGFVDGPSLYAYARNASQSIFDFNGLLSISPPGLIPPSSGPCSIVDEIMGGKKSTNRPGQRGGQAHRDKVDERIDQLKKDGNTDIKGGNKPGDKPEQRIDTPNGEKQWRQPDVSSKGPDGKQQYDQIGKSKQDGSPISREQKAIDDIQGATGVTPKFTPYDR